MKIYWDWKHTVLALALCAGVGMFFAAKEKIQDQHEQTTACLNALEVCYAYCGSETGGERLP